jgi:hypothetical protein
MTHLDARREVRKSKFNTYKQYMDGIEPFLSYFISISRPQMEAFST